MRRKAISTRPPHVSEEVVRIYSAIRHAGPGWSWWAGWVPLIRREDP